MLQGVVYTGCEATLPLVGRKENGQRQLINAVIGIVFNGFRPLPSTVIPALDLISLVANLIVLLFSPMFY